MGFRIRAIFRAVWNFISYHVETCMALSFFVWVFLIIAFVAEIFSNGAIYTTKDRLYLFALESIFILSFCQAPATRRIQQWGLNDFKFLFLVASFVVYGFSMFSVSFANKTVVPSLGEDEGADHVKIDSVILESTMTREQQLRAIKMGIYTVCITNENGFKTRYPNSCAIYEDCIERNNLDVYSCSFSADYDLPTEESKEAPKPSVSLGIFGIDADALPEFLNNMIVEDVRAIIYAMQKISPDSWEIQKYDTSEAKPWHVVFATMDILSLASGIGGLVTKGGRVLRGALAVGESGAVIDSVRIATGLSFRNATNMVKKSVTTMTEKDFRAMINIATSSEEGMATLLNGLKNSSYETRLAFSEKAHKVSQIIEGDKIMYASDINSSYHALLEQERAAVKAIGEASARMNKIELERGSLEHIIDAIQDSQGEEAIESVFEFMIQNQKVIFVTDIAGRMIAYKADELVD